MSRRIHTYADALTYIYGFADYERDKPRVRDEFKLDGVRLLLAELGNPHEALRCVHVAGTKGKGSTAAMIASVLRAARYSVGTYSSPHLHTHRERYRLDGEPVGEEIFTRLVRELQPHIEAVNARVALTTYDLTTALAFELFKRRGVDWAVIEVGLGGRLDGTNVITPAVSVITSISLDHTEVLGTTIERIAGEKAGIIKPGVPVVVAPQTAEAMLEIARVADEQGSELLRVDEYAHARHRRITGPGGQTYTLETGLSLGSVRLVGCQVELPLQGAHQIENALTTTVAVARLVRDGARITSKQLLQGLSRVRWPGRFEVVEGSPIPVVLDAAHNPDSVRRLTETMREVFGERRVACVFAPSLGHDAAAMLPLLSQYGLVLSRSSHPRSTPLPQLEALAESLGLPYASAETVPEALRPARTAAGAEVALVCGSVFAVADARRALGLAEAEDPVRS